MAPSPSEQLQLAHEAEHASWLRPCFCLRSVYFFFHQREHSHSFLSHHLLHLGKMDIDCWLRFKGVKGRWQWVNLSIGEGHFCQNAMHSLNGDFTSFFNICLV
ncbi:unnamed protein product [Pipistrellus nathusii]|uniref:Uncharacterized protein n=1 Tax=Pipistrellus nathusii TaxID=59473 RepID=A0ABN9ZW76_PIPNA